LLQQVNNQLVHGFLSQQNNRPFLLLSELMSLFVAGRDQSAADQPNGYNGYNWGSYSSFDETSQQPISQTTWLKVTPHCNHYNHCSIVTIVSPEAASTVKIGSSMIKLGLIYTIPVTSWLGTRRLVIVHKLPAGKKEFASWD
jgi:Tfp pilus assembly protein PilV